MTDRDALFQAILDAPDDDAPRLIFADWLDEHGDTDRAEFIRVQCEMARTPFYEARYVDLERRVVELSELQAKWRFDWLAHDSGLPVKQVFRRGFVEELSLTAELFTKYGTEIFRQMPLRRARFWPAGYYRAWKWNFLNRLEGIEFEGGLNVQMDWPELPKLRWLKTPSLFGTWGLLEASTCPRMDSLDLSGMICEPQTQVQVMEGFVRRVNLTRLRAFALDALEEGVYPYRMRAAGARMLAEAGMNELRQLHLRRQLIGEAGVYHLSRNADLRSVEELYLDRNDIGMIGPTGIEDLCSSSTLPHLRVLSLAENPIGAAGVAELAAWPGLRNIRWLDLSGCELRAADIKPLTASPYLHEGLWLRLDANEFIPDDLFPQSLLRRQASLS